MALEHLQNKTSIETTTKKEEKIGREKQQSRTFQIDFASIYSIHDLIDSLLLLGKTNKLTIDIKISTLNGGIAGMEYTETQKIR